MKSQRSESDANRQLKAGARAQYGHQPRPWPKAARPTWGTMEATGKPLWAFLLGRKS